MSPWRRLSHLRATVANWPLVALDKLGLVRICRYRTRSGLRVVCRARTTDINEVVVVLSGLEYPARYLRAREGDVVVDVGANIGSFVLYFASLHPGLRYRGFAIEPFTGNFDLLSRNTAANGIEQFSVHQLAIVGTDGDVRLRTDVPVDEICISEDGTGVTVAALRLSTFCSQHGIDHIDLLKMDAEGSEYDILEADFEFVSARVARLILECHEQGEGRTLDTILERLGTAFDVETLHRGSATAVVSAINTSWQSPLTPAAGPEGAGSRDDHAYSVGSPPCPSPAK